MNRLDGRIAFVSGGARGIGAATARLMAQAGALVAIGDVLDELGHQTACALHKIGGECLYLHLDVTRAEDWMAAVSATVAHFGGLDILVNNAGIFLAKDLEESTAADWERLCSVNLTGVIFGTQAALPALRDRGAVSPQGSAIVNLSSIVGLVGSAMAPLYSLTKGGVTAFTKSMALECARRRYRVRVNSIHPGIIDDAMGNEAIAARARKMGEANMELAHAQASAAHPIGRLGTAADIANAIVFLASDDSGFMTGSALVVDGGWTAQ